MLNSRWFDLAESIYFHWKGHDWNGKGVIFMPPDSLADLLLLRELFYFLNLEFKRRWHITAHDHLIFFTVIKVSDLPN